jgi:hypothetical protein
MDFEESFNPTTARIFHSTPPLVLAMLGAE